MKQNFNLGEQLEKNEASVPNKKKSKEKIVLVKKFSPRPFSKSLMEKYNLIFDQYKRFWIFDRSSGLWSENAETIIEVELRKELLGGELLKKYYVSEIIADVKSLSFAHKELEESPAHLIPFNDLIYDLKTDERFKYNPKFFFTAKLAVNFNPDAVCPFIDGIFSQLVSDPADLFELAAYCLYRDYPYAKWFFLYGTGGNGKTVFSLILEKLLGKQNIRSITPEQFCDNNFAVADLHGKFANLSGEMSYNTLGKTAILKQLVGGDLLRAERKYKEPFYFNNTAKLIFNTNSLPKTSDKTRAFYRRLYLIEFPNTFEGKTEDKLLLQKVTKNEIEGLAMKCIGFLMNLYDRGFFFINDCSTNELTEKYEKLSNPLVTFLAEETKRDDPNEQVSKWEFRELFVKWLKDKGFRVWNVKQINKEMKQLGYEEGRPKIEGRTDRAWLGLGWK